MKNKKILITTIILIVIVIAIVTVILLNKQKVTPEDILKDYMAHITNKDYEAMYELTTKETAKEDYITRNKNIYEGIEVSEIDINVAKTTKKRKRSRSYIYNCNEFISR